MLGSVLLNLGCGSSNSHSTSSHPTPNPLAGQRLYVAPNGDASQQAEQWRTSRPADAKIMDRLAAQPEAQWLVGENDTSATIAQIIGPAQRSGEMPVLVLYNIPKRDCGSYSAGGATSPDDYRAWINVVARALGHSRLAVIVEPDALAGMDCLSPAEQQTRLALLAESARTLTAADPQAAMYLDAGNSTWQPASVMVKRLLAAGASRVRGFSLNVSNFNPTSDEAAYGQKILAGLGPGHGFVIDTSRNGNGPAAQGADAACNPEGRALGHFPEAAPPLSGVDALFWIKAPGQSDGTCNGGPPAGTWWPDYALGLAQRAGLTG